MEHQHHQSASWASSAGRPLGVFPVHVRPEDPASQAADGGQRAHSSNAVSRMFSVLGFEAERTAHPPPTMRRRVGTLLHRRLVRRLCKFAVLFESATTSHCSRTTIVCSSVVTLSGGTLPSEERYSGVCCRVRAFLDVLRQRLASALPPAAPGSPPGAPPGLRVQQLLTPGGSDMASSTLRPLPIGRVWTVASLVAR